MLPAITSYLAEIGCEMPEIPLLQPADPFLDTTGEDLRRRIFITHDNTGASLCLRPEFTVPICLHHLQNANGSKCYAYGGTVFRQRNDASAEFVQAGFEDLGNRDVTKADANCIQVALGLLARTGLEKFGLVIGNQSVFTALLDALEIPVTWHKKLMRSFGDGKALREQLLALSGENADPAPRLPDAIMKCLEAGDRQKLAEAVADTMLADGLPLNGGRTPQAIAERIHDKHQLSATVLAKEKRQVLEAYLAIDVPLATADGALQGFARDHDLQLEQAIAPIAELSDALGEAAAKARFKAGFGRRLDYYTGLVFEVFSEGSQRPVIGGGRYDHLLSLLGAREEIPAVGFAVWTDRLEGV